MPNASISASRIAAAVSSTVVLMFAPSAPAALVPATSRAAEHTDDLTATTLEARRLGPSSGAPAAGGLEGFDGGLTAAPWDNNGAAGGREGDDRAGPGLGGLAGAPAADALPLSKLGRGGLEPKTTTSDAEDRVLRFLKRAKSGGLPEPASWALILIGFGMIGGAVRGFVVANRRLAKLQPEETE
jgi:hypothetical protein